MDKILAAIVLLFLILWLITCNQKSKLDDKFEAQEKIIDSFKLENTKLDSSFLVSQRKIDSLSRAFGVIDTQIVIVKKNHASNRIKIISADNDSLAKLFHREFSN